MKNFKSDIELSFETKGRQDLSATLRTVNSIKEALKSINSLKTGLSGAGRSLDSVSNKVQTQLNKMEGLGAQVKLASTAIQNFVGKQKALNTALKENATALQAQMAALREISKLSASAGVSRAGVGGRPAGSRTISPEVQASRDAAVAARLAQRQTTEAARDAARQAKLALATRIADENKSHRDRIVQIQAQVRAETEQRKQAREAAVAARRDAKEAESAARRLTRENEKAAASQARAARNAERQQAAARRNSFRGRAETRFSNSVSNMANGSGVGGLVTGAAAAAGGFGIFNAMKEMDSLRKQLEAVSGSTEKADDRMKFLNKTANELGANTKSLIGTFTGFSVAGEAAGMTEKEIREITKSITKANTVMNAANPETLKRGMIALQQMLGKGTVQMEELKGQFGDAFKDAIPTAAAAAGMSVAELTKAIEQGAVKSKEFIALIAREYEKKYAGSVEKAGESIQAQQNRIANSFNALIDELNKSGAAEGIAKGFTAVNEAIKDAFDPKNAKDLAIAIGQLATTIGEVVASVIRFTAENPQLAKAVAYFVAAVAAIAALKFAAVTLISPVAALWTTFGGASVAKKLIDQLTLALAGTSKAAAVARAAISSLLSLKGGVITLGVAAVAAAGSAASNAAGSSSVVKKIDSQGVKSLGDDELTSSVSQLESSRNSWNPFTAAAKGLAKLTTGNDVNARLDERIALAKSELNRRRDKRISDQQTLRAKEEAAKAKAQEEENKKLSAEQEEIRKNLLNNTGGGKGAGGTEGRSASAQANEMRSAMRAAARINAQAELEVVKATRERKLAELERELEAGKLSYARYFDEVKQARIAELEEEKAAVMERIDDEISAEQAAMADAVDAASKKAIQVRIDALEQSKITKEMALQERAGTVLAETEEKRSKAVKDLAKEYANLASEVDQLDGIVNLDQFRQGLETQYSSLRQSFAANGNTSGVSMVDTIINRGVASRRLENTNTGIGNNELAIQNQIAELELKVMEYKSTSFETDQKSLELKKQLAQQTIAALEAELAITDDTKTKLELNSRILDQKKILVQKTAEEQAAQESVGNALEKMFGDAQTLTFSLKQLIANFVSDIANDMQKQLSKKLSEMAVNQIFGGDQSAGGGGGIVGTLLGGLGSLITGSFGGGPSAGGGLSSMFSGMGMPSVSTSAMSGALGSGISPSAIQGSGSIVNMIVNTPDANSFRASKTQINQQLFSAGQRAASRS